MSIREDRPRPAAPPRRKRPPSPTPPRHSHTRGNLVTHLRSQFETYGDSRTFTYLRESGRDLAEDVTTFAEIDRGAREVAAWLSSRPEANRPVLLLFHPGVEFWRAFLGCLYAGVIAIPAPLPRDHRSMKRVAGILHDAHSRLALTSTKLRDPLVTGIDALGLERPIVCVATDNAPLADPDSWTMPQITADTVAFLQYTSGSTGDPKGVVVTHANVLHNERGMAEFGKIDDKSSLVGWIPHFHDMGLMCQLLGFYFGANVVLMSPLAFLKRPVRLLEALSKYRATATGAPNFAYDLIARRVSPEQLKGLDLSSVQVALNGAEPIRRSTVEAITELLGPAGFRATAMRPGYGMAEVTLFAAVAPETAPLTCLDADADALEQNRYAPARRRAINLVSSGEPAPGVEVRIVDPDTLCVRPDGHVGEIWLRGASVASGYYNRPSETKQCFGAHTANGDGPYLRTGDLGFLHEGQLYVTGRRKDLLIINGRNLYPQDIEDLVRQLHPATDDARGAAIHVPNDVQGTERLVLIQSVNKEKLRGTSLPQLATDIKRTIARAFHIPAPSVVLVGRTGIHLTTSGKVQRASMRTAFLRDELSNVLYTSIEDAPATATHQHTEAIPVTERAFDNRYQRREKRAGHTLFPD